MYIYFFGHIPHGLTHFVVDYLMAVYYITIIYELRLVAFSFRFHYLCDRLPPNQVAAWLPACLTDLINSRF